MSISSSFALFMGGGFLQDHLIIVSHARKDFGFLSSSSVVKASQLGRKMGIYLRSGRTPQAAQKSRFRRVARLTEGRFGVGYRSPCYPAAFPAPFPPSLIRGGRLHVIKLRDRRPGEIPLPPPPFSLFFFLYSSHSGLGFPHPSIMQSASYSYSSFLYLRQITAFGWGMHRPKKPPEEEDANEWDAALMWEGESRKSLLIFFFQLGVSNYWANCISPFV